MTPRHYDVIVIGSGGGLKIALPAAMTGFRTALIEPGAFGGTCLATPNLDTYFTKQPPSKEHCREKSPRRSYRLVSP